MANFIRRLEKLEQKYKPPLHTPYDQNLLKRIEAGRRRVREDREQNGTSEPSEDDLPPLGFPASRGIQLTMDILRQGRKRNYLRRMTAKEETDTPVFPNN